MIDFLVNLVKNLPPEVATFILAMLPVTELRASIPIGIGVFGLHPISAFFFSIIADLIPAFMIMTFLKPISLWLSKKSELFNRLFNWWFDRSLKRFSRKYEKYGVWALMIFVAIPLPITGAWTGATAAYLLDIPRKKALPFIFAGVVVAGIIVTFISVGAFRLI
jgi:uncharacterized membrane protein